MTDPRTTAMEITDRLKWHYARRTPLPRCDGRHVFPCEEVRTERCVCDHQHGYTLTLNQLGYSDLVVESGSFG